ncbi:MAG: hypothetical protein OEZ38_03845 [Gammaproteobacteria bacterium]|nr:hypothetical protein [Gammaproteobacteria bacterium]
MTDCCDQNVSRSEKTAICPVNGQLYPSIDIRTVLHQIARPWQKSLEGDYFFCADLNCDVVYFNQQGQTFHRSDLRKNRAQISDLAESICYCFDVAAEDITSEKLKEDIRQFIIEQTRNNMCACSVQNPSGKCCLKDFK